MIIKMYSIYDLKAAVYTQPWGSINDGTAIRTFTERAQGQGPYQGCPESRHPEDYALHQVGEYDDKTAVFTSIQPKPLGLANEFLVNAK